MDSAEWLTRGTVWLALSLYVTAETVASFQPGTTGHRAARWLSGFGVAAFVGHVACAFHFHHRWSHAVAYADTARQTSEFSGWNWGGGLYLNYLFTLIWLGEWIWNVVSPTTHAVRRSWISWTVRAFFMFMIFNGAVVFARSPMHWYGLALCGVLAGGWWQRRKCASRALERTSA